MITESRTSVERLLSAHWNREVRCGSVQTLREGKVFRVRIAGEPASVLVKTADQVPGVSYDPEALTGGPAQLLLEEWAGLAFLNEVLPSGDLVPKFYGGDRDRGLVVLEDLGPNTTLVDPLQGHDPDKARRSLVGHAQAIGQLHAGTVGQEARYWQIRDALGPRGVPRDWLRHEGFLLGTQGWGNLRALKPHLLEAFERLGQPTSPIFWEEYDDLVARMDAPSPLRSYVQSDSCPDNTLFTKNGVRLIDFEKGGFHFSLLDAAYARLSMPHCFWAGRLPEDVIAETETAYRKVVVSALPQLADDQTFGRALTEACAYWVISNGTWLVHQRFEQDFDWGAVTWRQRTFLRLEQFAAASEQFSWLTEMGAAARETVRRLRGHWSYEPVPLFPAFR